jgi:hypothetical protein
LLFQYARSVHAKRVLGLSGRQPSAGWEFTRRYSCNFVVHDVHELFAIRVCLISF